MKNWIFIVIVLIAFFGSATAYSFLRPNISEVEVRPDHIHPGQEYKVFFEVENHLWDKNLTMQFVEPERCLIQKGVDEFNVFIPSGGKTYYVTLNSSNRSACEGNKFIMLNLKNKRTIDALPVAVQIAQLAE